MQPNQDIIYNSMYENRKYLIFPTSQLDKVDFNQVLETSAETVRRSLDGTKTFVKWDGAMPQCVIDLTTSEGPYTYEEILVILATPEWTDLNPMV
jgi:hypothetical protein